MGVELLLLVLRLGGELLLIFTLQGQAAENLRSLALHLRPLILIDRLLAGELRQLLVLILRQVDAGLQGGAVGLLPVGAVGLLLGNFHLLLGPLLLTGLRRNGALLAVAPLDLLQAEFELGLLVLHLLHLQYELAQLHFDAIQTGGIVALHGPGLVGGRVAGMHFGLKPDKPVVKGVPLVGLRRCRDGGQRQGKARHRHARQQQGFHPRFQGHPRLVVVEYGAKSGPGGHCTDPSPIGLQP